MSNEVPLQKQIVTLDLSKGLDERSRPETLPIVTGITKLENLVQDQAGSWVKRKGTVLGPVSDTSGTGVQPVSPKKIVPLVNGWAVMADGGKLLHKQDGSVKFRSRSGAMDFSATSAAFIGSSGPQAQSSTFGAQVLAVASNSTHDAFIIRGLTAFPYGFSERLIVCERSSGTEYAYDLAAVTFAIAAGAGAGQYRAMCFVGDRYLHVYASGGGSVSVIILDTASTLPATDLTLAATGFVVSTAPISQIHDAVGGASASYVSCYNSGGLAYTIFKVNNSGGVVVSSAATAGSAIRSMALNESMTTLFICNGGSIIGLNSTTLAVSVAAFGPAVITGISVNSGNVVIAMTYLTTTTFGGSTIPVIKSYSVPSGTAGTLTGACYGWAPASHPFWCSGSGKHYLHVTKQDPLNELSSHAIIDLTTFTGLYTNTAGLALPYGTFKLACQLEPFNGLKRTGVDAGYGSGLTRAFHYAAYNANELSVCVPYQVGARTAGIGFARLRLNDATAYGNANFSGSTNIAHGGLNQYDGSYVFEQGFADQPTLDVVTPGATVGLLNGAYRYVVVYRHVDSNGCSSYSRTYGPVAATNVAATTGKNNITVAPPGATNRDSGHGDSMPIVDLYRTISGGTTYLLCATSQQNITGSVQQIAPDATTGLLTVTDNMSDATLASQAIMYRQPGTPNTSADRYPSPATKVVIQHKDRLFTVDPYGQRVYYSSFFVDGEAAWFNPAFNFYVHAGSGPITALASMDGRLFVFKRDAIFVVDGDGPSESGPTGNEYSPPQRLASPFGCLDHRSVVVTSEGIMFKSSRGIEMLTRSLQLKWTGDRVQNTVAAYPVVTGACMDWDVGRARFTLAASEPLGLVAGVDGAEAVYDFSSDTWSVCKYTGSAGVYGRARAGVAVVRDSGSDVLIYADDAAGVYETSETALTDNGTYVPFTLEVGWMKQAPQSRQRVTQIMLLAKKRSGANHALKMSLAYDYSDTYTESYTWQPNIINALTVEQLEMLMSKPQALAVRAKFEDLAPSDTATYPIGTGAGADLLGVAAELALKSGMPKLGAAQKGLFTAVPAPTITSITPTSGTDVGGTAITNLAGTGFVSGATVKIGGVACTSVVFVSSTKLTCVTPAGSDGAQDVVVTNPDAQTGTLVGGYTYTALAPTLSSLNYSQGNIVGGGQSIVATGTNCSSVTSVTILGNSVAPSSTTPTTVTFTLPAHAAGVGTVALVGPGGTSGTLPFEYWNPSTILPKLWVHDYAGTPWTNSGTVADTLVALGTAPTVGTAVNGHTPATFNGTTQALEPNTNFESVFLTVSDGTAVILTKPSAAAAPAANFYDDPTPLQGAGGNWGISFTSSGAAAGLYNGANQVTSRIASATGSWHLFAARWTAGGLKFRMDQTDATPAAGVMSGSMAATVNVIARNYNGLAFYSGDVLEVFETQSSISDADLTKYRLYVNQWYGLSI